MILEFEKFKDEVLSKIESFKLEFSAKSSTTEYILNTINNIYDNNVKIVKSDGTDVTEKFIKSLQELMADDLGREYLYEFKTLERDILFKSDGIFFKIPNLIPVNSEIFSINYIPDNKEIARCVVSKTGEFEYTVDFMELINEYKHFSFYDILKDCINKEYGNVDMKFERDLLGRSKTGSIDKIPEVKVETNIQNPIQVPDISLKICDIKLR